MASKPGTPTDLPLITAEGQSSALPFSPRKRSGLAAAGAVSLPSYAWSLPSFAA
jgi:hypothetical protein